MIFPHFRNGLTRGAAGICLAAGMAVALSPSAASADVVSFAGVVEQGVNQVEGLDGAARLTVSADGTRLYIASPDDSALSVFRRDAEDGGLEFINAYADGSVGGSIDDLSGVADVAAGAHGAVYAVSLLDHALLLFKETGDGLELVETYRTGTHGIVGLLTPARIALSPDGAHVYVGTSDPGVPDAIHAFRVSDGDGRLVWLGRFETGIDDVAALTLSPDGRHVYIAEAGGLTLLTRSDVSSSSDYGQLAFGAAYRSGENGVTDIAGVTAIALDGDGESVYVTGSLDNAIVVFDRDADSGLLAPLASYRDGENGIGGLARAFGVAVSPDGGHVYVVAEDDDALTVLRRDRGTGLLSHLETHRNGNDGIVDGLDDVLAIALSADGANLYTASPLQAKVGIFSVPAADVSLSVSGGAGAGDVEYHIVVSNNGPAEATGLKLSGPIPDDVVLGGVDAPAGVSCGPDALDIVCEIDALAAGNMVEIDVRIGVTPPLAFTYTGAVYANQRDPDLSNNVDSILINVPETPGEEEGNEEPPPGPDPEPDPDTGGNGDGDGDGDPAPEPPAGRRSGGGADDGLFLLIAAIALAAGRLRRARHVAAE